MEISSAVNGSVTVGDVREAFVDGESDSQMEDPLAWVPAASCDKLTLMDASASMLVSGFLRAALTAMHLY